MGATSADELTDALARLVRRGLPGYDRIAALTRLSGGASQQTWAFEAQGQAGVLPAILRRLPPESGQSPTAIGLVNGALHRTRDGVGVEDHATIDIASRPTNRLHQTGFRA